MGSKRQREHGRKLSYEQRRVVREARITDKEDLSHIRYVKHVKGNVFIVMCRETGKEFIVGE